MKVSYSDEKKYNINEKTITVSCINLNIKPNLFLELGNLFDKLNTPEKLKIIIKNLTINKLNISTTGNIYK